MGVGMAEEQPHSDRNLLFGALALKNGFVTGEQLAAGVADWEAEKTASLASILKRRNWISDVAVAVIEALVAIELGDARGGLAENAPASDCMTHSEIYEDGTEVADVRGNDWTIPIVDPDNRNRRPVPMATDSAGRYAIERLHAAGAMGEVFVAKDGELSREVAVKHIREQYASNPQQRMRFLLEAEITGGLEHPGVVPVYSLGKYKDGRPFYAMRLIRGESLKEAIVRFHREGKVKAKPQSLAEVRARQNGVETKSSDSDLSLPGPLAAKGTGPATNRFFSLPFRSLLRRYVDVCNAMAYAHSRGVLHRDLKPGNIMLGKYGETLVVDWGLAKLLGKAEGDDADNLVPVMAGISEGTVVDRTRAGSAVGTPAYMSPEQAAGKIADIGVPADIYSLGATLFTILTGRPAFTKKEITQTLDEVRSGKFKTPRSLNPEIPQALEAICLKAMSLEPARRYATALDLAGDIERWLADEPVTARRESAWTLTRRWMRKHPGTVTGLAATILVGLIGVGANLRIVAGKNELLELQKTELAQANSDLKRANENLQTANREQALARQKAQQKECEARALVDDWFTTVSESKELKQTPNTQPLRKQLLGRAKEYYETAVKENADDEETLKATAAAFFRLAFVTDEISPGPEALAAYEKSLAIRERLVRDNPKAVGHAVDLARTYGGIGKLFAATGRINDAFEAQQKALAVQLHLTAEHADQPEYANDLANTHNNIGAMLQAAGNSNEALAVHQRALAILEPLHSKNPKFAKYANDLAATNGNIGNLWLAAGNMPAALEAYQKSQAAYDLLTRQHPTINEYLGGLAATHGNIGNLKFATGKRDDALESYRKALDYYQKLATENPTLTRYSNALADTQTNLGLALHATGKLPEAQAALERASTIYDRLARENPSVVDFKVGLGGASLHLGNLHGQKDDAVNATVRFTTAIVSLCEALKSAPGHGQATQFLGNAYLGRARNLARLKRSTEAVKDFDQAIDLADGPTKDRIRTERDVLH